MAGTGRKAGVPAITNKLLALGKAEGVKVLQKKFDKNKTSVADQKDVLSRFDEKLAGFDPSKVVKTKKVKKEPKQSGAVNLLAKSTYSDVAFDDLPKIIKIVSGLIDKRKGKELKKKEKLVEKLQEEIKVLKK